MNEPIIENRDLKVNAQSNSVTIQRGKHDKEHPYVMIAKAMLRDKTISPKAKGVLSYLLTLPSDWVTHPRQLAEALGVGKDQIYSALTELLVAGYAIRRETKREKGKFGFVVYEFFEEKLTEAEIKEKNTVSGNPDPDFPDPEKPTLLNNYSTENTPYGKKTSLKVPEEPLSEENSKLAAQPKKIEKIKKDFPEEVIYVANEIVKSLIKFKADYAVSKNIYPLLTETDFLLRLDKRNPQKIIDVFNWALSDSFWSDKMFKPNPAKYLRQKFDQLEMKMLSKPSAEKRIDRRIRDEKGQVIDEFKDLMF